MTLLLLQCKYMCERDWALISNCWGVNWKCAMLVEYVCDILHVLFYIFYALFHISCNWCTCVYTYLSNDTYDYVTILVQIYILVFCTFHYNCPCLVFLFVQAVNVNSSRFVVLPTFLSDFFFQRLGVVFPCRYHILHFSDATTNI